MDMVLSRDLSATATKVKLGEGLLFYRQQNRDGLCAAKAATGTPTVADDVAAGACARCDDVVTVLVP
jgi:hypothetical protein